MPEETHPICYRFFTPDRPAKEFHLELEVPGFRLRPRKVTGALPRWTNLGHEQCSNCPLPPIPGARCPVAVSLVDVVEFFADVSSYEECDVEVTTPSRSYAARVKSTGAAGSLLGIYMVTSGCPILDRLRPMVLTHLPFATTQESIYRAISMYLLGQFLRMRRGEEPDWELERFHDFFDAVEEVNQSFVRRLSTHVEGDASLNALVFLNCFASATRRTVTKERFDELECLFSGHFEENGL